MVERVGGRWVSAGPRFEGSLRMLDGSIGSQAEVGDRITYLLYFSGS